MTKKGNKANQKSQDHESGGKKNFPDGDVRVHGAIEVHPSPHSIAEHDSERKEDRTEKTKQYVIAKNTFIAVGIYSGLTLILVALSGWNVYIARQTFINSNRPYIGITGVHVFHIKEDATGKPTAVPSWTSETNDLHFNVETKNFGTVPGRNTKMSWKVFFNGVQEEGMRKIPDRPFTYYPGQTVEFRGETGGHYTAIMNGQETLELEVNFDYDGPSDHYHECEKQHWQPQVNAFFNLGPCSK